MPTASPIISARVGVVVDTVVNDATVSTPASVVPTPRAAVTRGRPAASRDENVIASTRKAMATPISSVVLSPTPVLVYIAPPSVLVNPAPAGGCAAFSTCGTVLAGRSVTATSNWTWASASCLSVEMVPTAPEANGSSTLLTCFTLATAAIRFSMSACCALTGRERALNTIWPVVPEACGKRWARVSMPRWDSVPGMVKSLISLPPVTPARATTTTARKHQTASTTSRRRATR